MFETAREAAEAAVPGPNGEANWGLVAQAGTDKENQENMRKAEEALRLYGHLQRR
jgi:hypothetical protein